MHGCRSHQNQPLYYKGISKYRTNTQWYIDPVPAKMSWRDANTCVYCHFVSLFNTKGVNADEVHLKRRQEHACII